MSLFLSPARSRARLDRSELELLTGGSLVGHLLKCAGQHTGGYFADGERKQVPG